MINAKDVIRMRIPFPSIDSTLAVQSHMYVCLQSGIDKEFVKCQTYKPDHENEETPPYKYIIEESDLSRNPFQRRTTIDCDKTFTVSNVTVDASLLTTSRPDVCDTLFTAINNGVQEATEEPLNPDNLRRLNHRIR